MMNPGRQSCPLFWRRRLQVAQEIADRGGNLTDVAAAWGVSTPRVSVTMRRHDADLHQQLKNGERKNHLKAPQIRERLTAIRDTENLYRAAKVLGMQYHTLYVWFHRNFPDGLALGIEDYLEEAA